MFFKYITQSLLVNILKLFCLFYLIYLVILISCINYYLLNENEGIIGQETTTRSKIKQSTSKNDVHLIRPRKYLNKYNLSTDLQNDCTLHIDFCFDLFQCKDRNNLKVYVYTDFSYGNYSKQFQDYIRTIVESEYYEPDPTLACIFIPDIDLLNEDNINLAAAESYLHSLAYWASGKNHFIFNMKAAEFTKQAHYRLGLAYQAAILSSSAFQSNVYRNRFDVTAPLFNPLTADLTTSVSLEKKYKIVSTQPMQYINGSARLELEQLALERSDIYIFGPCADSEGLDYLVRCRHGQKYDYDQILSEAEFCLIFDEYDMFHSHHTAPMVLFDVLKFGCIPLIVSEEWLLPYSEFLDWDLIAIQLRYFYLKDLSAILLMRSEETYAAMRKQVKFVYERYFSSMKNITLTMLKSLEMSIFPNSNYNSYDLFNFEKLPQRNPFAVDYEPIKAFTAVIIGSKQTNYIIELIEKVLVKCPSIRNIELLWFGRTGKRMITYLSRHNFTNSNTSAVIPVRVTLMKVKQINTIFYPFTEYGIAESLLLVKESKKYMISVDQIEDAFELWRRSPDRFMTIGKTTSSAQSTNKAYLNHNFYFYHYIYNHYYMEKMESRLPDIPLSFECEIDRMNDMIYNMTGKNFKVFEVSKNKAFYERTEFDIGSCDI